MKKLICSLILASGGLVISTLIPTKANAATLTFTAPPLPELPEFSEGGGEWESLPGVLPEIGEIPEYDPNAELPEIPEFPEIPESEIPELPFPEYPPDNYPPGDYPSPDPNTAIVPEPITMFGTATALGLGVLFKRKSSKKKKS